VNGFLVLRIMSDYQVHVSAIFVLGAIALRSFPGDLGMIAQKMTSVAYPLEDGRFGSGREDWYLVSFMVMVLILLRVILQHSVFNRIADMGQCDRDKFTMQGWHFSYYTTIWIWGFIEYYNSDYFLDMPAMWDAYPQNKHTFSFKIYYLFQLSFWMQMVFVTLIEKWQKDFIQMMAHHFITIFLIATSYFFNFVRIGHVVLVEQDLADIFLPLAKMFKYFPDSATNRLGRVAGKAAVKAGHPSVEAHQQALEEVKEYTKLSKKEPTQENLDKYYAARKEKTKAISQMIEFARTNASSKEAVQAAVDDRDRRMSVQGNICDAIFAIFAIVWIPTRHGIFFLILHSLWYDFEERVRASGNFAWDPERGLFCFDSIGPTYFGILCLFQCLLLMWLLDLIKAVYRSITGPKNVTEIEDPHEADSDDDDILEIDQKQQ